MTCIIGLRHEGKVFIGGDSAGVDGGYGLDIRADRKVVRNRDFLMGFTSSFRMGQLLAHSLQPPLRAPERDVYAYMVTDFVDAVRHCLKGGGFAHRENEVERGGTFLVGYAGRLFAIEDDYQVAESTAPFMACGCGDALALGAVAAQSEGTDPANRIRIALTIAERFSAGVRGPFHIESI